MTFIHSVKSLKNSILIFLWNSHTCILDYNLYLMCSLSQKNAYTSIISVILNGIIADIINCLFQKCPNCFHLHTVPTDIKMHIHALCFLLQTFKGILTNLINIPRFPGVGCFFLVKLGNLDHILNQLKQSLGFLINTPCKLGNILTFHQTALHDLRKS